MDLEVNFGYEAFNGRFCSYSTWKEKNNLCLLILLFQFFVSSAPKPR